MRGTTKQAAPRRVTPLEFAAEPLPKLSGRFGKSARAAREYYFVQDEFCHARQPVSHACLYSAALVSIPPHTPLAEHAQRRASRCTSRLWAPTNAPPLMRAGLGPTTRSLHIPQASRATEGAHSCAASHAGGARATTQSADAKHIPSHIGHATLLTALAARVDMPAQRTRSQPHSSGDASTHARQQQSRMQPRGRRPGQSESSESAAFLDDEPPDLELEPPDLRLLVRNFLPTPSPATSALLPLRAHDIKQQSSAPHISPVPSAAPPTHRQSKAPPPPPPC